MLLQGNQGSSGKQVGQNLTVGLGEFSEQLVSELHAPYYEQTYRGLTFFGATPSGQTTSVGLSTTYVGLALSNPLSSKVNLVLLTAGFSESVINAAVNAIGLMVGFSATANVTHGTPVTAGNVQSSLVGSSYQPIGKMDTAATLTGTPVYHTFFATNPTAITNAAGFLELKGSIVLPPGAYVATATVAASSAASFWASMSWMEVPV